MTPLERKVEELEQRIAILECGLCGTFDPALRLGFTFTETQILAILLKRSIVSTEVLWNLLWGSDSDAPESKNAVAVHITHLRKRLKPYGVAIKCRNRFGYSIHNTHKAIIKELIANATVLESAAVSEPALASVVPAAGAGSFPSKGEPQWEQPPTPTPRSISSKHSGNLATPPTK